MINQKSKIKNQKLLVIITLISLFLIPNLVVANLVPCGGPYEPPCRFCHLFVMLDEIIDFALLYIVFPLATLLIVFSGGTYMFSSGDEKKINEAKSILTSTIVGLIIIFSSWILVNTFMSWIGVAEWTGIREGWFKIPCP